MVLTLYAVGRNGPTLTKRGWGTRKVKGEVPGRASE
jgi:hypothetical protein